MKTPSPLNDQIATAQSRFTAALRQRRGAIFAAVALGLSAAVATLFFCASAQAQTAVNTWAQSYGVGGYDAAGNPESFGLSGHDLPAGIARMPDGGVVVTGELELPAAKARARGPATLVRYSASGVILWQRTINLTSSSEWDGSEGHYEIHGIQADSQGNIFVAGYYGNSAGGLGGDGNFVAKLDATGTLLWRNSISGVTWTTTDGNGQTGSAFFSNGAPFYCMNLTADGGVVVGGIQGSANYANGQPVFNANQGLPMIAKFEGTNGNLVFTRLVQTDSGGADAGAASAVCQSLDGTRYLELIQRGSVTMALVFDAAGNVLTERTFNGRTIGQSVTGEVPLQALPTVDGGFLIFATAQGALVRKVQADLTTVWEKVVVLGTPDSGDVPAANPSVAQTADGGFLLSGWVSSGFVYRNFGVGNHDSNNDAILIKLDANCNVQTAFLLGGELNDGPPAFYAGAGGGGDCHAVQTTDGAYAFTLPSLSYATAPDPSMQCWDWWTVKVNPDNGRVPSFQDVMVPVPTTFFSTFDNSQPSTAGGDYLSQVPPGYNPPSTSRPVMVVEDLSQNTGINKPNVQFQAAPFNGVGLSLPTDFTVTAPASQETGQPWTFTVTVPSAAAGLTVRVQASLTALFESSWMDLPNGGVMQSLGGGKYTLTTGSVPYSVGGSPVFFRVLAKASGFTDSASSFSPQFYIAQGQAPVITSALSASGQVGQPFNYQIAATANPTSYGAAGLPAGLSVNTSTGVISGTPAQSGTFQVTITATNGSGTGMETLVLTIAPAPVPAITSPLSAGGRVGDAFNYQITATNNPTSFSATGLPVGLSVNTSTGVISGTPQGSGSFNVTISATNAYGTTSAVLALSIDLPLVQPPAITSTLTANGTVGVAFSYQITATNSPTSFNASGLPAGLSVNTSTGVISGTPQGSGTFQVTISAANTGGSGSATLTIKVNPAATSNHHPFFTGEVYLGQGVYYLNLPNGGFFGYYGYLSDSHYIYHFDMGYEYAFDDTDARNGVYFYDFASNSFFYTSPSFPFPYLYDFTLKAVLYYFPDASNPGFYTNNPRYFFNTRTGQIITK